MTVAAKTGAKRATATIDARPYNGQRVATPAALFTSSELRRRFQGAVHATFEYLFLSVPRTRRVSFFSMREWSPTSKCFAQSARRRCSEFSRRKSPVCGHWHIQYLADSGNPYEQGCHVVHGRQRRIVCRQYQPGRHRGSDRHGSMQLGICRDRDHPGRKAIVRHGDARHRFSA